MGLLVNQMLLEFYYNGMEKYEEKKEMKKSKKVEMVKKGNKQGAKMKKYILVSKKFLAELMSKKRLKSV